MARLQRRTGLLALAGYLAISAAYLAPGIAGNPTGRHIGGLFTDPQIFIWALAWWPHAILHGENPFYTHAVWAPNGVDLAWTTSIPALAIPLAPLTLAFGPIFAYNVACILMPALAAWGAFLLCRHLTRQTFASLVGGYLFGFSSYVLSAELSHIHSAAVFLLPFAALLIVRFARREVGVRTFVVLFGVLVAVQLGLSTELLLQLTLALAIALVFAVVLVAEWRRPVRRLLAPLAGAYAFAAVLALPFVYYLLTGSQHSPNPVASSFEADLANYVVPTRATFGGWWTHAVAARFPGNDVERGAYIGLPALVIIALFAVLGWRKRSTWFLVLGFVAAAVLSLGSKLTVVGHRLFSLPWSLVAGRSIFVNVMPVRFSVFCALIAAVVVSLWVASRPAGSWLRFALPGIAVLAVLPNLTWHVWARTPAVPLLFRTEAVRDCIPKNANVIVFPIGPSGDSMIWQADSGFWFRIAGGYITPAIPSAFLHPAGITHLTTNDHPSEITAAAVRELARLKGVSTVVVDAGAASIWAPILRPLGKPQRVGGALIYRLRDKGEAVTCSTSD